ncbi:unnamed protein product [Brassica oleracea]
MSFQLDTLDEKFDDGLVFLPATLLSTLIASLATSSDLNVSTGEHSFRAGHNAG